MAAKSWYRGRELVGEGSLEDAGEERLDEGYSPNPPPTAPGWDFEADGVPMTPAK